MRADLLASLQERMVTFHADESKPYTNNTKTLKLIYYANRSTPQLCKPGQTVKGKAGYGKRVKVKTATPEQVKQAKSGKWIRDRHDGKKPNEAGAKKSAYRPWLHASIEKKLIAIGLIEASSKKSNNPPDIETDTDIIPSVVADTILQEVWQVLPDFYSKRKSIIVYLHEKANSVYSNNESFMKKIKNKKGLDTLYVFMRHWASAYIKKNWGDKAYKTLEKSNPEFANGIGKGS